MCVFLNVHHLYAQSIFDYKSYTTDEGLPSSAIVSIFQDEKGFIIVNTKEGIVKFNGYEFEKFNPKNQDALKPSRIILPERERLFFKNKSITTSTKDIQGSFWVGTESDGLFYIPNYNGFSSVTTPAKVYHFLKEGDSLVNYGYTKKTNDLSNHKIENQKIEETLKGLNVSAIKKTDSLLFIATNKGLFQFNKLDPNTYKIITKHNGLPSNEIFDVEIVAGNLYVATQRGVSIIELNKQGAKEKPLPVIFPYVRLNNEKQLFPKDEVIVKPKYKFLTLRYLCLDYKAKGDILYKYKIDGIHEDWIITKDTKIQFTSLPQKGNYVFKVKVKRSNGKWSAPSVINLVFVEPFYKTVWFLILSVLFLLLFLGIIIRWFYVRNIKNQKLKSELLKLENSALQSQMNPHFVFNALNSIQSFISTGDSLKSEVYLSKFSNLLRKTLNSSRLHKIELHEEIESLTMYLELEKLRFGDKLSYQIQVDDAVEIDFIKIPPMLIQPFIENAILHGLSPKKGGGEVVLKLELLTDNELLCTVTDNGVGRKNKPHKTHKSLGINIVKKRLSIISGSKESYLEYTDLYNENKEPMGTKVKFIIPI